MVPGCPTEMRWRPFGRVEIGPVIRLKTGLADRLASGPGRTLTTTLPKVGIRLTKPGI